jgi:hypothetical protein
MKSQTNSANDSQRSQKPKRDDTSRGAEAAAEEPGRVKRRAGPIMRKGSGIADRGAVLETQRQLGNAYVQRQLSKREGGRSTKPDRIQRAPADESARPTSIGDGSASVTAENGQIELEAGMTRASVLQADTLIADSVVATNYTPGAGNVY